MTTVAAVCRAGRVFMAADSQVTCYDRPVIGGIGKILRLATADGQPLLAGASGSAALAGLLEVDLEVPAAPADDADPQRWAYKVARAVTQLAVDTGCVSDGQMDGSVLLGWNGRVWTLTHAQAIPHVDGIAAIGSGEGVAIGAVDALLGQGVDPADAVRLALQIACTRDVYSSGPAQLETLEPPVRAVGEEAAGG